MPIDTSIYNGASVHPFNPLQTLGQGISLSNAAQQNQLIQQQIINAQGQNKLLAAKLGLGDKYSKFTDPKTGMVDMNGLQADVANDPTTANALPIVQEMANTQNKLTQIFNPQTKTLENITTQGANSRFNPVSAPQVSQQHIDRAHDNLQDVQDTLGGLLQKPNIGMADVLDASADLISRGRITPNQAVQEFGNIPPGENGSEPSSDQLKGWLQDHYNNATAMRAKVTSTYGTSSSDKQPEEQTNNVMANEVNKGSFTQNPGAVQDASVPVGYQDKLTAAQGIQKQVRDDAATAPAQAGILNNILDFSKQGVKTGPGTSFQNNIKSFLSGQGIASDKMNDEAAIYQEMVKYMTQLASQNGAANTDSFRELQQHSNPSDPMLPKAIQDVTKYLIAANQGKLSRLKSMESTGTGKSLDPDQINEWNNQWQQNYDPRALEFATLPAKERAAYLAKHPEEDYTKIVNSFRALRKLKAIE